MNSLAYGDFGSIPQLIRETGSLIRHVHLHDCDGRDNHLPIGAGSVEFGVCIQALREVGYRGALSLEIQGDDLHQSEYRRAILNWVS